MSAAHSTLTPPSAPNADPTPRRGSLPWWRIYAGSAIRDPQTRQWLVWRDNMDPPGYYPRADHAVFPATASRDDAAIRTARGTLSSAQCREIERDLAEIEHGELVRALTAAVDALELVPASPEVAALIEPVITIGRQALAGGAR